MTILYPNLCYNKMHHYFFSICQYFIIENMVCLGSKRMDCVISESSNIHVGTNLHRKDRSFSYNSFVNFHSKNILGQQI